MVRCHRDAAVKQFEDEPSRLKRIVADRSLEKQMLQDVILRKL